MERKMKKLLVILMLVCMIVPSVPQKAEATGEEVSGTTRMQFVTNDGYNADTGNFGQQQFDGKNINSIMGTEGYAYLFHTKFQSTTDVMSAFDTANNPYMQISYLGWGNAAEQYFIGLYKGSNGWSLKLHRGSDYWAQNLIKEYSLTDKQVAEIADTGLNIFLVNSDSTTFTVFVEKEGVIDTVGSLVSPKDNKQVYQVKHTSKDTAAGFTTTGYFYGSGYTRATAAQTLTETTEEEFTKFVTLTDDSTIRHGDKFNKFIYHTKVQGDLSQTGEKYIEVLYYIWGSNVTDNFCVRVNLNGDKTAQILLGNWCTGQSKWYQATKTLSAKQVKKIKGSGLNLYFVHDGQDSKHFEVYAEGENSESVSKICELDACHGDHVYQTAQTKKDGASVTTIGYQYVDFLSSTTAPTELYWADQNANTGDVNDDGDVSVADIVRAKKYANGVAVDSINVRAGDMDHNRSLTEADMSGIRERVLTWNDEAVAMDYNDSLYCQTNSTATVMNSRLFYRNTTTSDTVYGADPSVMEITKSGDKNQGKYLMMVTGNSDKQSIPVYISSDLTNWKKSDTIELKDENGSAATTAANADIWAMEMVYDEDKDKYYLFFSATPEKSEGSTVCEVPYVAVGNSYTGTFQLINHDDYKYADGSSLDSKEGSDALGYASSLKYSVFDPYQIWNAIANSSDPYVKEIAEYEPQKILRSIDYQD